MFVQTSEDPGGRGCLCPQWGGCGAPSPPPQGGTPCPKLPLTWGGSDGYFLDLSVVVLGVSVLQVFAASFL